MHPIERLRYVARSAGAPQDVLVQETAIALAAFRDDPIALVTACRRIVSRQLTCGGVWWLCSRMLCAPDPLAEARRAVEEINDDSTARQLAAALPADARVVVVGWPPQIAGALVRRGDVEPWVIDSDGVGSSFVRHLQQRDVDAVEIPPIGLSAAVTECDLVLIEAACCSPDAVIATMGSRSVAAVAQSAGVPVWLVAGVGRVLPDRIWQAMVPRFVDSLGDDPWDADEELVPLELFDALVGPGGLCGIDTLASRVDCPIAPELFKADIT